MILKRIFIPLAIVALTACGGGGADNPPSAEVEKPLEGYNPNLAEQTLTPEQLADVDEIAASTTVTVEKDVILTATGKDLIIKGNLIIK